jgi:hypothetical protein
VECQDEMMVVERVFWRIIDYSGDIRMDVERVNLPSTAMYAEQQVAKLVLRVDCRVDGIERRDLGG